MAEKMTKTVRQKLYRFDALSPNAKFKALSDHINFEIETMDENSPFYPAALEMEKKQTPWFLAEEMYHNPAYREILEETLRINDYWFTADGKLT